MSGGDPKDQPRLLFVVNTGSFFISHRLPLAVAARGAGFEVHVLTEADTDDAAILEAEQIVLHRVPLERGGLSVLADLRYLMQVMRVMRVVKPDIVHNVTMKPVLYGTLAARLLGVRGIVDALAGLGYAFAHQSRWMLSAALRLGLRVAFRCRRVCVILQNSDDLRLMNSLRVVRAQQAILIRGSGVDLDQYVVSPEDLSREPLIVLPARLLRDKGILEFAEASALLAARGCIARFAIAGPLDDSNPAALTREEIDDLLARYSVSWLGNVKDVAALYRQASIVCLPSYREGLPKALLEACAAGRAIVTTDVPGCREVVAHEVNGLLVPVRNATALADALQELIGDPQRRARFGMAGRRRAEEEFDLEGVVAQTLALYERILNPKPSDSASKEQSLNQTGGALIPRR
jgi:glycosyltransferase involved in cell wall biosynthesis